MVCLQNQFLFANEMIFNKRSSQKHYRQDKHSLYYGDSDFSIEMNSQEEQHCSLTEALARQSSDCFQKQKIRY